MLLSITTILSLTYQEQTMKTKKWSEQVNQKINFTNHIPPYYEIVFKLVKNEVEIYKKLNYTM